MINKNKDIQKTVGHFADKMVDLIGDSGESLNSLSTEIGISSAVLSKYQNANAEAGIGKLVKISEYFNVSCDYLLGLHNVATPKMEIQAIHNETGLNENAVFTLQKLNGTFDYGDEVASDFFNTIKPTSDDNALEILNIILTLEPTKNSDGHDINTFGTLILKSIYDYCITDYYASYDAPMFADEKYLKPEMKKRADLLELTDLISEMRTHIQGSLKNKKEPNQ